MNRRLLFATIATVVTSLVWIGASSDQAFTQVVCPTPAANISPTTTTKYLAVIGSYPQDSDAYVVDVTGRDGQVLTISFTARHQQQNANDSLDSVTGQVLLNGEVMYSGTITEGGPAQEEAVTRSWTVPTGATQVTLEATLTLNNDPPSSYTSGFLFFRVGSISIVTPEILCETEWPESPSWDATCGVIGESEVTVPAPPDHVAVESSGWSDDGIWTVAYVADVGYFLPAGFQTEYTFVHPGPCEAAPPLSPQLTAVCGPDNDVITLPDQPGEVVAEDSGWTDNERTITFYPTEGFIFPENTESSFTFEDESIPCDVEPEGKQVTVVFATSDGGSIEGTTYALFGPDASQVSTPPYTEGLVGSDNRIVLNGLLPGTYRLVAEPDGYEPVDILLTVDEEPDPQEITVDVLAIQVIPTPTPARVPSPTPEPAPPAPTAPARPVSVLPNTGSGSGTGWNSRLLGVLIAAGIGAVLGRNHLVSRQHKVL